MVVFPHYVPTEIVDNADNSITVIDPIYGKVTINEAVLIDVINSNAVQRLKGVYQHGITDLIGLTPPVTRFEHSLGAMLLCRRLGCDLEEQISAVLHDISHTAFSHVIDYAFKDDSAESYHESVKMQYVASTDLPGIFKKHNLPFERIMHEHNFSVLEQDSPRLCADRVDYGLRDCTAEGFISLQEASMILNDLTVFNGIMSFKNPEVALLFSHAYMRVDNECYTLLQYVGLYQLTADLMEECLAEGIISKDDLFMTDRPFWNKIKGSSSTKIQDMVKLVDGSTIIKEKDGGPYSTVRVKCRTIDPDIVVDGKARVLSTHNPKYKKERELYISKRKVILKYDVVK